MRLDVLLVAATLVLSAIAWARWERPRELAPGLRLPAAAVLVAEHGLEPPGGNGCRVAVDVSGAANEIERLWTGLLTADGWEPGGDARGGDRLVYRRGDERLLAGIDPLPGGAGTRIRITLRPCPERLLESDDPRVIRER